ncbi:MAG: Pup--protein ligase [Actinomycetota bacterium]|jgi:proteasome accessory factor A
MQKRIFGLETEYGITCVADGIRRLSPDEVARYLFRRVVAWGRSSNIFLTNGARLYLDVGSHPEYATAECDDLHTLVVQDRAGERILESLVFDAQKRMQDEGIIGKIHLFKNNTDSAGNSYGCHENYLVERKRDFNLLLESLVPFLITRQVITGAGRIVHSPRGSFYSLSQRADHIWEGVSSATTRSRPIINTRDEPHADAEKYRRLHVIVGDSNMSEVTTQLKVTITDLMLKMLEDGIVFRDFTIENPIRAIRDISNDIEMKKTIKLANGKDITALAMQREYFEKAQDYASSLELTRDPIVYGALDLWQRAIKAGESQDWSLIDKEIDFAIKYKLLQRYKSRGNLSFADPKMAMIDLSYHDINRDIGIYYLLEKRGQALRITNDEEVTQAKTTPPQTTRAKLRGDFIARAQEKRRDFTVDWVHLKLNDQTQRTVLCKDPFKNVDERVERLLETM